MKLRSDSDVRGLAWTTTWPMRDRPVVQIIDLGDLAVRDAGEGFAEPGLWIDGVWLCRFDQGAGDGGLWQAASDRFPAMAAESWHVGNLFLAGDACHMTPHFLEANGGCMW